MGQPHTSVAGAAGEGEETGASGKRAYLTAGLVLRESQWHISKPRSGASWSWRGGLPCGGHWTEAASSGGCDLVLF